MASVTASTSSICSSRALLLDRLAGAVENLGRVKLDLTCRAQNGDSPVESYLRTEIARLRSECGTIRLQLEAHRAAHGC